MKPKRLIVNADDFGWTKGITDGIVQAHKNGLVTSTSLLANQPTSEYAIAQLRSSPELGVGIHLNLCSGIPVLPASQVPSLVGADGRFHPAPKIIRRLLRWAVSGEQIEAEFRAQIRWARERGVDITHADSHYHVHLYPAAVRAFQRAVVGEGIPHIRSPLIRVSPENGLVPQCHAGPAYRRIALIAYTHLLHAGPLRQLGSADSCVVPPAAYRANPNKIGEGWRLAISHLPEGCFEFSCHPGIEDGGYPDSDTLRERRKLELQLIIDPELKYIVEKEQIQLINYRAV